MSHVTSVIILSGDYDNDLLPQINAWLDKHHYGETAGGKAGLVDLTPHFGGRKHPQAAAWGGAFNYLSIKPFLTFLRSLDWKEYYHAQVVIEDEHDWGHTMVTLWESPLDPIGRSHDWDAPDEGETPE